MGYYLLKSILNIDYACSTEILSILTPAKKSY